jgi:hypothetical protein
MSKVKTLRQLYEMFTGANSKAEVDALATKLKAQKNTNNADVIDAAKSRKEDLRDAAASAKKAPAPGVAGKRAKVRANKEGARFAEQKGSISKTPVTATAIKEAKTANSFDAMQRRLDAMEPSAKKDMLQNMLDKQKRVFEKGQAGDVQRMENRSAQSNRDRTKNKKENVSLAPGMDFSKGGTPMNKGMKALKKAKPAVAKRMGYNKGGYANCGASMKPTQGKK